ncbi:hypothetical protein BKA83DRAFT_4131044 [Pisolithus microcarpus]|nr:hypothetical protein BKA83DRAFT_4131044 [Pisolithus microcarpus]
MDPPTSNSIDPVLLSTCNTNKSTSDANTSMHNASASTHNVNGPHHDPYAIHELTGRKMACLISPNFSPHMALKGASNIKQYLTIYNLMLHCLPWLEDDLETMDAPEFDTMASKLSTGMSNQCSMDLSSVKHTGLAYIPLNMNGKFTLDPPLLNGKDKSDQGTMTALQTGNIPVTTWNWPTFFYEGHVAWQFFVHLFTGPSEVVKAITTSNTSKKAKNCAWDFFKFMLHIITHAYFTLTAEQKCTTTTGNIDLAEMAWVIVDMFEDGDEWTHEIHAFPEHVPIGSRLLKHCFEPDSCDDVMHIWVTHGSTSSRGTSGNNTSSNHTSTNESNLITNTSESSKSSMGSTGTSGNTSSNFSTPMVKNHGESPLTSDEEVSLPVHICCVRLVLKKCKNTNEMIFTTDIEDHPAGDLLLGAQVATHSTCQHGGKEHANCF